VAHDAAPARTVGGGKRGGGRALGAEGAVGPAKGAWAVVAQPAGRGRGGERGGGGGRAAGAARPAARWAARPSLHSAPKRLTASRKPLAAARRRGPAPRPRAPRRPPAGAGGMISARSRFLRTSRPLKRRSPAPRPAAGPRSPLQLAPGPSARAGWRGRAPRPLPPRRASRRTN
jgi:23S rRNA pseudouridine2605 synthase